MSRPTRLRADVPAWAESEILNCILSVCEAGPAGVACLRAVADELRQPDPRWDVIRGAIREAQATFSRRTLEGRQFRHCFAGLEARLSHLFSERKRDWVRL